MENWDFDCPKYVNLASGSDESVEQLEKYFEEDHEHVGHRPNTRAATAAQAALKGQEDIKCCRNSQKNIAAPSGAGTFSRRQACFGESDEAKEAEGQSTHVKKSLPKKERVMNKNVKGRTLSQVKNVSSNKKKGSTRNKPPMQHPAPSVVRSTFEAISMRKGASTSRVNNTIVPSAVKNSMPPSVAKKHIVPLLVQQHVPPSAVHVSGATALHVRKGAATSTTSKPIVPSAVKRSMPLSAVKSRIVPLTVEQHVHPSAICKGATAALRMRKDATPAVRKPALPAAQCQSLAEFVGKFHSKTPTRFRRVPKDPGGHYEDMRFKAPTIPVSPKLSTRLRSRTVSVRDQKRKADHVNICASEPKRPMVEAVQVDTQATPVSKPALNIEKDEQDSLASKLSTKPPQEKIANTAASSKVLRRVTVAKSPAFSLKLRSETWKQRKQMEERTLGMKSEKQPDGEVGGKRDRKPPLGAKRPQAVNSKKGSSYQGSRQGTQDERKRTQEGHVNVEKGTCNRNRKKKSEKQLDGEVGGKRDRKPPLGAKRPQAVNSKKGSSYQGSHQGTQDERKCTQEGHVNVEKGTCNRNRKKTQEILIECEAHRGRKSCGIAKKRNRTSLRRFPSCGNSCVSGDTQPRPFRARPAPDRNCMFRLRNISAPPTVPRPFRLASVERHHESQASFKKKKEEMEAERLRNLKFVARPVPRSIRNRSVTRSTDGEKLKKPGPSAHVSRPRKR